MIIGYQVQDQHGNNWAGRPANFILTESSAMDDLALTRSSNKNIKYKVVGVLQGDIANPVFEDELTLTKDRYSCIGICTSHLSQLDRVSLDEESKPINFNMIASRETGWLVKLHDEHCLREDYKSFSDSFFNILLNVHKAGYRMIEFDSDASEYDCFPLFELES